MKCTTQASIREEQLSVVFYIDDVRLFSNNYHWHAGKKTWMLTDDRYVNSVFKPGPAQLSEQTVTSILMLGSADHVMSALVNDIEVYFNTI